MVIRVSPEQTKIPVVPGFKQENRNNETGLKGPCGTSASCWLCKCTLLFLNLRLSCESHPVMKNLHQSSIKQLSIAVYRQPRETGKDAFFMSRHCLVRK